MTKGSAKLKAVWRTFPRQPGVYLMRDEADQVIYVGKAKDLRARVASYFRGGDGRAQIQYLMRRVQKLEKIVVTSEEQALILERDLISKYKPRYNVRLKDDKAYLSIRLDENAAWPKLELVRKVEQDGANYYGPYTSSYELREIMEIINRVLPLRTCRDAVFHNRQRPCLEYQIKRCAGPCCLPVDPAEYRGWVKQAKAILEGRSTVLAGELKRQMEAAAAELNFEAAAGLRDRLSTLESFAAGQAYVSPGAEDRDVLALYREDRLGVITLLKVRNGRIAETRNFPLTDLVVDDEEVLAAALDQYYRQSREVPEEIIVPQDFGARELLQDYLSGQRGAAVSCGVPQRGLKYRLLRLAQLNARQHFATVFDAESRAGAVAEGLARLLRLKQVPRRIECLDISNLQGSDIVGAVVAFYDGRPDRSAYRRYRISFQDQPDDFAAVAEVLTRRLRAGNGAAEWPDLMIIDGGAGQLSAALAAQDAAGSGLELIALAKERSGAAGPKPERVFLPGAAEALVLDTDSEVTKFLVRVRDEAHRFVIDFHRRSRSGRVLASALDEIPGVGPQRRARLLRAFGSVAALRAAAPADLARAGRMPLSLAERVLQELNKQS